MRAACLEVATRLAAVADRWTVVAADPDGPRAEGMPPCGTFLGYGVDVPVSLAPGADGEPTGDLPLPLLVAGWLRGRAAPEVTVRGELVPPDLPTEACRRLGAELAGRLDARVALLVVGDGAITHTERAPGYLDRRAHAFDAGVAAALAGADPDGLLALDAGLAAELGAAGRAPWQVLAGAAIATTEARGGRWRGELLYSDAPYGVRYHVALWSR
jgi:hypothetical protein